MSVKVSRVAGVECRLGRSPSLPRGSLLPEPTASFSARGFPFFFLYFPFFYLPILISLNLELVPPCRIAIHNVTSLAIELLSWCTSGAFLRVGAIGIGCDRSGLGVLTIGQHVV